MSWDVTWDSECYDQLETIWKSAADRNAITRAAIRIDRLLASDPIENSESREFDQRILFDLPLVVTFVVDFEHSEITVIDVRCVS